VSTIGAVSISVGAGALVADAGAGGVSTFAAVVFTADVSLFMWRTAVTPRPTRPRPSASPPMITGPRRRFGGGSSLTAPSRSVACDDRRWGPGGSLILGTIGALRELRGGMRSGSDDGGATLSMRTVGSNRPAP